MVSNTYMLLLMFRAPRLSFCDYSNKTCRHGILLAADRIFYLITSVMCLCLISHVPTTLIEIKKCLTIAITAIVYIVFSINPH